MCTQLVRKNIKTRLLAPLHRKKKSYTVEAAFNSRTSGRRKKKKKNQSSKYHE